MLPFRARDERAAVASFPGGVKILFLIFFSEFSYKLSSSRSCREKISFLNKIRNLKTRAWPLVLGVCCKKNR